MNNIGISGQVNMVVALSCEARPLIQRFNLKQERTIAGLRLYQNQDGINLIVSGVGKLATATACGFLAGTQSDQQLPKAAWLNIGIAGHKNLPIGEGALAHKVTDQKSERVNYPPLILSVRCPTTEVITVDRPETGYDRDAAYDMEASVFAATAGRFITSELVQIYKVISDNPQNPVEGVTEHRISEWVAGQLTTIDQLVSQLLALSSQFNRVYSLPEEYFKLAKSVHLTASQRVQLESGYRRYYALGGTSLGEQLDTWKIATAQDLLLRIESLTAML